MDGKILGKITSAEFGSFSDMPFLFGLKLEFKLADGACVGSGGKYTENFSKSCKWSSEIEKNKRITELMESIYFILNDAHVCDVSGLKNIPVEVILDRNSFKDFRVLTEVL